MHSRSKKTLNTTLNGTSVGETITTPDLSNPYALKNIYTKQYGIDAGSGSDRVTGGYSDDEIRGGSGNDVVSGSYGFNELIGGTGTDRLDYSKYGIGTAVKPTKGLNISLQEGTKKGNSSNADGTLLLGDETMGFENVYGSQYADKIYGNDEGDNKLYGLSGRDFIAGKEGNDYLSGGKGRDELFGGLGNDRLVGGDSNDKLNGQSGDDILIGGKGADIIYGNDGRDVFDYNRLSDSTAARTGRDYIQFKNDQKSALNNDKIDLSGIDAKVGVAGNNKFFIAGRKEKFSGKKGELIYQHYTGKTIDGEGTGPATLLRADVDGDKKTDFSIAMEGTRAFTSDDIIL
jgi:Ca2+-binding RTX toxin-like protein